MDSRFSARLSGYFVIEARLLAVEPADPAHTVDDLFRNYPVSLDFRPDVRSSTEAALYTKIAVNGNKRPLPGYAVYIEAMSLFEFVEATPASAQKEWLSGEGLSAAVGNLREVIAAITAYGPFGRYVLPENLPLSSGSG